MAKKKGRFKKGDPSAATKSSHYGYDTYLAGPADGPGKTRCLLRKHRIPSYIQDPLRSHLPDELTWPERNHADAHAMIDAIYDLDCKALVAFMRVHPGHHFGFEDFLIWAERRVISIGKKAKFKTTEWPASDKIVDRSNINRCRWEGLTVDFNVIRLHDGDAWGELIIRDLEITLTRALVDLQTNRFLITHHFPGRYKARQFYLPSRSSAERPRESTW
jgi:hypothetical protein